MLNLKIKINKIKIDSARYIRKVVIVILQRSYSVQVFGQSIVIPGPGSMTLTMFIIATVKMHTFSASYNTKKKCFNKMYPVIEIAMREAFATDPSTSTARRKLI